MRKNGSKELTDVNAGDRHFVTSLQKGLNVLTCLAGDTAASRCRRLRF